MGVHIEDNKIVLTIGPKTFYFDLPEDLDNNLKYKIDYIIKTRNFQLNII